ncbi:hypothetical protein HAX54_017359, partial [Datura stramonium]|nr:hypothetical protein [Datura stramonium]
RGPHCLTSGDPTLGLGNESLNELLPHVTTCGANQLGTLPKTYKGRNGGHNKSLQ